MISKPVPRKGKIDKPPFSPILDDQHDAPWMCSHSNPEHWGSYDTARAALRGFSWLGFVFSAYDPYSGIDLDGCRDKASGAIEEWAERIIRMCASYTEISPSEEGVKIWVRGTLPATLKKAFGPHVGIEIYSKQRYFTLTGNHLVGTPLEIRDAQVALDLLWTEYNVAPKAETPTTIRPIEKSTPGERAVDRDVIARLNAANDLGSLLESKGATLVRSAGDARHYSGLSGDKHSHAITYIVSPAKGGSGQIGYSYSPNGKLNNVDFARGFSWFDAICALDYSGVALNALKTLNPITRRNGKRREDPPLPEPPEYLTPAAAERREKDRGRKNAARKAEAADLHARIRQQAEKNDLTPAYRAVVLAQLEWMVERNAIACNLGVRRIADLAHVSYGRTKQALIDLRALGYYQLTACAGGRPIDTAVRNFARGSLFATQTILDAKNDPRIDLKHVCYTDSGSCERAPSSPAHENVYAASLDDWSWSADAHGADELSEREADHEICTLSPLGETTIAQQEAAQAPVVLDPCDLPPAWRLISDKRGMWSLRGPNGECEWLGCDENHARICWAVKNLQPGQSVHIRNDVLVSPLPPEPVEQLADLGDGYSGYAGGAAFNAAYVPSQEARQETPKAPVVIQLDPLVQAPPLSTDAAYTDFIWRWYAAQQTARSAAQRARFKREAESYLVDVSPEEATLRWEALRSPSRSTRPNERAPSQARARRAPVERQGAFL